MKTYSLDLRQRIVDAYEVGGISQHHLARNFSVTLKFVHKLLTHYLEFGTIGPKIRTEQTPIKLTPEQLEILRQLVKERLDSTLENFKLASKRK